MISKNETFIYNDEQLNSENITVVERGENSELVLYDYRRDRNDPDGELPQDLTKLLDDPDTKFISVEYFFPELDQHTDIPLIGKQTQNAWRNIAGLPVEANTFSKIFSKFEDRAKSSRQFSTELAQFGKPIVLTDIANKPMYHIHRDILQHSPALLIPMLEQKGLPKFLVNTMKTTWLAHEFLVLSQIFTQKGLFNPEKVSLIETFMGHAEDARRTYTFLNLQNIYNQLNQSENTGNSRIVHISDPTHNLRTNSFWHNESALKKKIYKLKENIYRHMLFGLDFDARIWEYIDNNWIQTNVIPINDSDSLSSRSEYY